MGVLGTRHHLTQRRIRNLLDQLTGLNFSVGPILQPHGKVGSALKAPVAEAAASLRTAEALWMDETHYPREGIANGVWAAVQPQLAVFAIYLPRARYVILVFIGQKCTATVTSDRYAGSMPSSTPSAGRSAERICCATSTASARGKTWPGRSGAACLSWAW